MKISNEVKVGVIAIISISLLILGFNFLKGKKVFKKSMTLYAVYSDVQGLTISNPVIISGLEIGTVYALTPAKDMRSITVTLNITKDINIPTNSVALIRSNPITNNSVEIALGDAQTFTKNNDTLNTRANEGMMAEVMKKVDPVLYEVKKTAASLDTLVHNINDVLDAQARVNIQSILGHLNEITKSLSLTSQNIAQLSDVNKGALAGSLNNINQVTENLAANNKHISGMLANLDSTSQMLAQLEIKKSLDLANEALTRITQTLNKANSDTGTIGLLLNDPKLYNNLAATSNKLNILMDDIRLHPGRYFSISLIGGKKKQAPLTEALPDTLQAPYIKKKAD